MIGVLPPIQGRAQAFRSRWYNLTLILTIARPLESCWSSGISIAHVFLSHCNFLRVFNWRYEASIRAILSIIATFQMQPIETNFLLFETVKLLSIRDAHAEGLALWLRFRILSQVLGLLECACWDMNHFSISPCISWGHAWSSDICVLVLLLPVQLSLVAFLDPDDGAIFCGPGALTDRNLVLFLLLGGTTVSLPLEQGELDLRVLGRR